MMRIRLDKPEYSRHVDGYTTLTATLRDAPVGTPLTVALVRTDGYGDVLTQALTPISATATVSLDLTHTAPDGISALRQGWYQVEARNTSSGAVLATSRLFPISAVPVAQWQQLYLFGIPLYSETVLLPVAQPQLVTGVTVAYSDPGMLKGTGILAWDADDTTLSWRGGAPVTITMTDPSTVQVLTPEQDAYLELTVDPDLLPTTTTTETLLIDTWRLGADDLRRYLWDAYDWVEQQIRVSLETRILTTDPATVVGHYDAVLDAQPYERGSVRTIPIEHPLARPLRAVRSLTGWYAGQQSLTLPLEWITIDEKAPLISLIPVSGGALVTTPVGATWLATCRHQSLMSDFWHFTIVSGMRDLCGPRAGIREAIEKKAAIDLLTDLSVAQSGGRTSTTAQRDGVVNTWSYGSGGVYGEKVQLYTQWLEKHIPKLRMYHAGLQAVMVS